MNNNFQNLQIGQLEAMLVTLIDKLTNIIKVNISKVKLDTLNHECIDLLNKILMILQKIDKKIIEILEIGKIFNSIDIAITLINAQEHDNQQIKIIKNKFTLFLNYITKNKKNIN